MVDWLRASLDAVNAQLPPALPDHLPILGYGRFSIVDDRETADHVSSMPSERAHLVVLLARVLLAFALDFEREASMPLAVCANVLRVLNEHGVRVRDLPALTGLSKAAVAAAMEFVEKTHAVSIGPDASGIGERCGPWKSSGRRDSAPLFIGLTPYAAGWRASVPAPSTLPHYPMVLHRGGYPDGS